jgi:hypothetical protein
MALHRHHLLANHALCSAKARTLAPYIPQKQYRAAVRVHALPNDTAGLPGTLPSVVTNDAVPEGHKSLHNALYGQDGDAHASSRRYNFREVRERQWCCGVLQQTDLCQQDSCSGHKTYEVLLNNLS